MSMVYDISRAHKLIPIRRKDWEKYTYTAEVPSALHRLHTGGEEWWRAWSGLRTNFQM